MIRAKYVLKELPFISRPSAPEVLNMIDELRELEKALRRKNCSRSVQLRKIDKIISPITLKWFGTLSIWSRAK